MDQQQGSADSIGSRGSSGGRGRGGSRGGAAGRATTPGQRGRQHARGGVAACYLCGAEGHVAEACQEQQQRAGALPEPSMVTPLGPNGPEEDGVLQEVYGDLMQSPDSLCHCVSECLAMGKGIAVLFHQRFGRVDELKAQRAGVGSVAILPIPPASLETPPHQSSAAAAAGDGGESSASSPPLVVGKAPDRFAYYLITKPRYFDKPTYDTLRQSLVALRDHMLAHRVQRLSLPELGCGLDGLRWENVHQLLVEVFARTGVILTCYHFKPARQMWTRKGTYAKKR